MYEFHDRVSTNRSRDSCVLKPAWMQRFTHPTHVKTFILLNHFTNKQTLYLFYSTVSQHLPTASSQRLRCAPPPRRHLQRRGRSGDTLVVCRRRGAESGQPALFEVRAVAGERVCAPASAHAETRLTWELWRGGVHAAAQQRDAADGLHVLGLCRETYVTRERIPAGAARGKGSGCFLSCIMLSGRSYLWSREQMENQRFSPTDNRPHPLVGPRVVSILQEATDDVTGNLSDTYTHSTIRQCHPCIRGSHPSLGQEPHRGERQCSFSILLMD